ncbi:MAG: MoaD/ThiS family protein [Betaproteobacteria bacterium]|nr:MoaD/ThiS family protein [Betaproteobacteria bacterium]
MITASVQLSGFPSRPARSAVEVSVAEGASIRDLVAALREQHPDVPELQQLRPDQFVIAVNEQTIKGLDRPLVAGGETSARVSVMMIRLLAGG